MNDIDKMPSKCHDCPYWEACDYPYICPDVGRVQPKQNADSGKMVGDCISRQAVIDLLKQMRKDGDMVPWEGKNVFARIQKLPSAQPKRKTGYKINQHQYPAKWVCSECGSKHFDFSDNFCSQCGADVKGEA